MVTVYRRFILAITLMFVGAVTAASGFATGETATEPDWRGELIRLHVIANSDSREDQALKLAVRDAVLAAMTPVFDLTGTLEEAEETVRQHLPAMEQVAEAVIRSTGKDDAVRAELGRFPFPDRRYGDVLLPAGEYTALRLVIGSGAGQNWWCVLFPPLCFTDWTTGVRLEPTDPPARLKPAGRGKVKVTPKEKRPVILDERSVEEMEVRARFRIAEAVRAKLKK